MILEFKIKNFLSFKDEVVFSFEATADTRLEDYYVTEVAPGVRLLKMAMVYGANASGKSNLLKAFNFIKNFIKSVPAKKEEGTKFTPFEFSNNKNERGVFELVFYIEEKRYKYVLELDKKKIFNESLFYYPGTQPAMVFKRSLENDKGISVVEFGTKIKISEVAKEQIQIKTLNNTSVFAAFSQLNLSISEITNPLNWFNKQFLNVINPYTSLTVYSDNQIKNNEKIKKMALQFLKEADLNISNILFEEEISELPEELLKVVEVLPFEDNGKTYLSDDNNLHIRTTIFEHSIKGKDGIKTFKMPEQMQSQGTMRYYGLTAPFFNTIEKDGFLPIDEIGSALHPLLVMHFLREFLKRSNQAQLLFTTHNLSLLMEKDILRKDAIWFTEKKDDGSSVLYSMADFNFRKELSFYNAYKQGKFGAIPVIDE